MTKVKFLTAVLAGAVMFVPVAASAKIHTKDNNYQSVCQGTEGQMSNGESCKPTVSEKVVPEYYQVPTKTQHIYYQQPVVQPVVTQIIHHVPTPVYGGQHTEEVIQAGPWTGPALACCQQQMPQPQPRNVYCQKKRYGHDHKHGHNCR